MATGFRRARGGLKPGEAAHALNYYQLTWNTKPVKTATTEPVDRMTLPEFIAAREVLRGALAKFESKPPTCTRCAHFEMGRCKEFGSDVPKDFQSTPEACASWVFDGIPF